MNTYDPFDAPILGGTFTDPEDGSPVDPTEVVITVQAPDATEEEFTFSAAEVTRESAGVYSKRYDPPDDGHAPGRYAYHVRGTGAVKAGDEKHFTIAERSAGDSDAP